MRSLFVFHLFSYRQHLWQRTNFSIKLNIHEHIPTYLHADMHTYILTYIHTCTYIYTPTHTHTHIHTHTYIYTVMGDSQTNVRIADWCHWTDNSS